MNIPQHQFESAAIRLLEADRGTVPEVSVGSDWPDPEPMQGSLPTVEAFNLDLLPASFAPLVADVSERMQVPEDFAAVSVVLCLAGSVSRRAVMQPKANDTEFAVVPNLWGGIVAQPGFMKSPVIAAVAQPLSKLQTEWRQEYDDRMEAYALVNEEDELRRTAWREEFKKATKKVGTEAPSRPEPKAAEPREQRLIVNDSTFEALHQTMSENPAGILVIRDELTGWLSQLDRHGREGERGFCLEAWNGNTAHTIDRIGRGTVHAKACCMSILGGIQPGRLRSYLGDALQDGPSNDGLFQRFQLLVWPDTEARWLYVDRLPDSSAQQTAEAVYRKLVQLDPENPARYGFAPGAQELYVAWLTQLEAKLRGDEHPALVSHLSKYRSLMPSLACLFEMADWAAGCGSDGSVSLANARRAAAWCDYLETHARRVYSCVVSPQLRGAQELAGKIRARKISERGTFTCRDVYSKGWSGLDSPDAVKMAARILIDAGWLRELSSEPGPQGGRPSSRYQVNPKVWP